jgi:hypothetical protein
MSTPGFFALGSEAVPPASAQDVENVEALLGVRLPAPYTALLAQQNGGCPRRGYCHLGVDTSWDGQGFLVDEVLGIGPGADGGILASRYLIGEWGYPDVGVVVAYTPSAGHEVVMLDYTDCGPRGEPVVLYVDERDRGWAAVRVAPSFAAFLERLTSPPTSGTLAL